MTEEMSAERKLILSSKAALRNAKNSESHFAQTSRPERTAPGPNNSGNNRTSPKDAAFIKERATGREFLSTCSDNRFFGGLENSRNIKTKRNHQSGRGAAHHSEVIEGGTSADVGSVFRPGSKKAGKALDELLNFSFDSQHARMPRRAIFSGTNYYEDHRHLRYFHKAQMPCYNKEQFLLANCQFVVKENYNYSAYLADPDLLVDWDCVEEVRLLQPEPLCCPICLYPPVAAQITRCGHVFCWPCVLHYLSLSDKQWRKCPICYESVYKSQLRSCCTRTAIPPSPIVESARITLHLMRRERGSNIVVPAQAWSGRRRGRPARLNEEHGEFAKLLMVNTEETRNYILNREREELKCYLDQEKGAPECCFIQEALGLLDQREAVLCEKVQGTQDDVTPCLLGTDERRKLQSEITTNKPTVELEDQGLIPCNTGTNSGEINGITQVLSEESSDIRQPDCVPKKDCPESSVERSYFFYQDGFTRRKLARQRKAKDEQRQQKRSQRWEKAMLLNSSSRPLSSLELDSDDIPISTFVQSAQREIVANFSSSSSSSDRQNSSHPFNLSDGLSVEINRNNIPLSCRAQSNESDHRIAGETEKMPSFAQMLKCGKPKMQRQTLNILPGPSEPRGPPTLRDEYTPNALSDHRNEFGIALQAAFENVKLQENEDTNKNESKKASKKKRGTILFKF